MQQGQNSLHAQNNISKFYGKLPLEIQKSKSIGRDPKHGPYPIYDYFPDTHLIYSKETKISTTHVVSWHLTQ